MSKYSIMLVLSAIVMSAKGQVNQNRRPIENSDAVDSYEAVTVAPQKVKPAEFPGGIKEFYKYVSKKMKFPKEAKRQSVSGKVVVQFVIDTVGNIKKESVKVIQSLLEACDKEAIRLIMYSPTWIPAVDLETNKKTETLYSMPIFFYSKGD